MGHKLGTKGSMTFEQVVALIIVIFVSLGLLSLYPLFSDAADYETAMNICRGSVIAGKAASEKASLGWLVPEVCELIELKYPRKGSVVSKDAVAKYFSDKAAKCWWEYGNGRVKNLKDSWLKLNLIGQDSLKKCVPCFQISTGRFSGFDKVESEYIYDYFNTVPYKVSAKVKTVGLPCELKGGQCLQSCDQSMEEINRKGWSCTRSKKCCIEKGKYVTYNQYLKDSTHRGYLLISDDIEQGESYDVSYAIIEGNEAKRWLLNLKNMLGPETVVAAFAAGAAVGSTAGGVGAIPGGVIAATGTAAAATLAAISASFVGSDEIHVVIISKSGNSGDICTLPSEVGRDD